MIVGNKTDLERKLPYEEIEATVCLDWDCGYAECSAMSGVGVEGVFKELANQARILSKGSDNAAQPLPFVPQKQHASLKRHSLVKRLFSREKLKESFSEDQTTHKLNSCKIS